MREMFGTIFHSITTVFRAIDKAAGSMEYCADWANDEAKYMRDSSRIARIKEFGNLDKQVPMLGVN